MTELLLYIGLMTMIVGCTMSALLHAYIHALHVMQSLHEWCMFSTAGDLFVHDIYGASPARVTWYQPNAHTLISRSGEQNICWMLRNTTLVRSVGIYKKSEQRWVKRTMSVVATGVASVVFTCIADPYNKDHLRAVQCEITGKQQVITRTAALRVGRVV